MEKWLERNDWKVFVALFFLFFLGFLLRYEAVGYGIGSGGNYYYFWLPTLIIDRDLNFSNQWDSVPYKNHLGSPLHYEKIYEPRISSTGRVANENSMGPAIFWAPFFLAGRGFILVANWFGADFPINGFSGPEQILSMFGSIFWSVLGLWLVYRFACRFCSRTFAFLSVLAITFGFAVVHYIAVEPSMAHGLTIFTVAAFITYLYNHRENDSFKKWAVLGVLGGLMMHSRWQEGFFFVVPLVYWIDSFLRLKAFKPMLLHIAKGFVFVGFVLLVFSPQMIAWSVLFGGATTMPDSVYKIIDFSSPRLFDFLFSFQHSLFISTPIILLAILGLPYAYKKDRFFIVALTLGLIVHIYVNASLQELGGNAFGARRMIDNTFFFVLCLSCLFERLKGTRWFNVFMALVVFLVSYNLVYLIEYSLNIVHRFNPVTPYEIFSGIPKIVGKFRSVMGW